MIRTSKVSFESLERARCMRARLASYFKEANTALKQGGCA